MSICIFCGEHFTPNPAWIIVCNRCLLSHRAFKRTDEVDYVIDLDGSEKSIHSGESGSESSSEDSVSDSEGSMGSWVYEPALEGADNLGDNSRDSGLSYAQEETTLDRSSSEEDQPQGVQNFLGIFGPSSDDDSGIE